MNKIDKLLEELCPEGVRFVKIGDICDCYAGATPNTRQPDYWENGTIPWMSSGEVNKGEVWSTEKKITQLGYDNSSTKMIPANTVVIALAGQGKTRGTVAIVRIPLCTNQSLCSLVSKGEILPDFLFHYLKGQYNTLRKISSGDGTRGGLNLKMVSAFEVPIPPIPVQEEIVRILDKFASLAAELQAELQARQKQYEYYRGKLLTFTKIGGGTQSVTWMKMSELFDIRNGYTPSKAKSEYWDNGSIPWFRMEDIRQNGRKLADSIQHITLEAVKGGRLFPAGSFIIATTATIGEHALLIADSLANQQFTNLSVRKSLTVKVNMEFIYHYLFIVGKWCKQNTNAGGFASVDMNKFKSLEIPIPPLAEQERIAAILDRFERLTTDLQAGLPAEIKARQQQYEYYRDRLLTFKRKTA